MTEKQPHPLAVVLVECFTLANTFEALANDARKDAQEAQAAMELLEAAIGFRSHGRVEHDDPSRELTPTGWCEQEARCVGAQNLVAVCEGLADTLRQAPLDIRDKLDTLMRLNEKAAEAAAPTPKRKRTKARL